MDSLPIPSGGDQNRGSELVAVIWAFTTLATIIVSLKIFTRVKILQELALDDLFTVFALLLVLICSSIITASAMAGMGRHAYYLDFEQRVRATKLNLIANPFGIMAYSLPNISVAIFIQRILHFGRLQKWLLYSVPVAQNIIAAVSCILLFAQCSPSTFLWDPTVKAKCLSSNVITHYSYFVGAYSAFTDIFLAILPAVAFYKLQMRTKAKVGVSLLMGSTALAAICAIVKTSKLNELEQLADFTYATVDLLIWAVIEADIIIIAACIPSLRPFAISVGQSIRQGGISSLRKRDGYEPASDVPLALNQMPAGQGGHAFASKGELDSHQSQASLAGSRRVLQTTDIQLEWESKSTS